MQNEVVENDVVVVVVESCTSTNGTALWFSVDHVFGDDGVLCIDV